MNIIEEYQSLTSKGDWEGALPVIEAIVNRAPAIPTSWFNWGVCLDELKMHSEAATKFRKVYSLDPTDYGAQYRVFRSLALAKEFGHFMEFLNNELPGMPEIGKLLVSDPTFSDFAARPEFRTVCSDCGAADSRTMGLGARLSKFFSSILSRKRQS